MSPFNSRQFMAATLCAMCAITASVNSLSAPAATDAPVDTLEDVVVTAQKTATDLEKTPIAISTFSKGQLESADIRTVSDLDMRVPGLQVMQGGAYPMNITIRGVGFDGLQNNSAQPGVALVENGVYVASPFNLTSAFLDLNQLEVLRGPQGTVNGQNADGGAINITTGMPILGEFHADTEASYGSYNYDKVFGVVNLPLSDTLAARLGVQHEGHSGWLDAPNQGTHVDDEDAWSGRAMVRWKPIDALTMDLWADYFHNGSNGLDVKNAIDPLGGRSTSNDYPTPQITDAKIYAADIAYDFSFATLKSITSLQQSEVNSVASGDLLDRAEALATYGVKDEDSLYIRQANSYTEEINLSHTGSPLDWIVGGFFLHSNFHEHIFETQQSSPTPIPYTANFDPIPAEIGELYGAGLAFVSRTSSERDSRALYGQGTYHITDRLRVTGGLRYSWDTYSAETQVFYGAFVPLRSSFTALTGKGVVEYDVAQDATLYGSVSSGVKPGGTNLNPGALVVPTSFQHETVTAYEVGSKNELLDRTLRLNVSAFYNDYRNLQTDSEDILPYDGGITNIPKSFVYGLEFETSVLMPYGFRIDADGATLHSQVDGHFLALDPYVSMAIDRANGGRFVGNDVADRAGAFQDLDGNSLARTPKFTGSIGLAKATEMGDFGKLDLYLQAQYRSTYWARVFNNPAVDHLGSLTTMNFNAHYQPASQPWYLEFQITNLTGSDGIASRFTENFGVGGIFDSLVPPRQFIGRIGAHF